MNQKEIIEFLDNCQWKYAKSYSKTFPHYYTTRDIVNDNDKFEEFLRYYREKSILKTFNKKQYLYLEIGEYEYWEMGRPLKAVQVLNKAIINDNAKYRYPVPNKTDEISIKKKLKQRDDYLDYLLNKTNKNNIELSQINFLMDTERRINGGGKNIIDHSSLPIKLI